MRTALVTGATGGIGRALVSAFRVAGHRVLATDIGPAPPDLDCDHYLPADLARSVSDAAYAASVFARIEGLLGSDGLHALVHNAAVQRLGGVQDLDLDDWQQTLQVNLLAPFFWTQRLWPALVQAQGCVLHISSIHARLSKAGFVAYATSKAALSGMTRAMAVDAAGQVRINAIEPAAIGTPMLQAGFAADPAGLQQLAGCHPSGRIGTPDEVAALAVAMCSPALGFLNGATVGLDGGIAGRLHDPA